MYSVCVCGFVSPSNSRLQHFLHTFVCRIVCQCSSEWYLSPANGTHLKMLRQCFVDVITSPLQCSNFVRTFCVSWRVAANSTEQQRAMLQTKTGRVLITNLQDSFVTSHPVYLPVSILSSCKQKSKRTHSFFSALHVNAADSTDFVVSVPFFSALCSGLLSYRVVTTVVPPFKLKRKGFLVLTCDVALHGHFGKEAVATISSAAAKITHAFHRLSIKHLPYLLHCS